MCVLFADVLTVCFFFPDTLTQEISSKSASQLGYEELLTLNTQGDSRTTNFKGDSGAAVLSAEEESIGKAKESEKLLNVYMTPFLSEVFEIDGRILVNGEEFGWIEVMPGHSQFNCKPDFAVGPAGYFDIKPAPNADERVAKARAEVTMPLRFGTPQWQLRDSVIVLESRKKISSEGFGELLNYLRHIHCPKFPISRGMLFDPTDFWLVECVYGVVTKRVISKWTAAGSVQLIRNFFPLSEWERVQLGVCEELKVTVIDDGFLGAGGSGRVFRVESDDRRGKALKLVLNGNIHGMRVEHALISDSERKKLPHLVSSSTDDIAVMDGMGAGYAMTPVGQQVTATSDNVDAIFASLNTLHEAKLVHGDARLANVVFCLGQHVWVDLMLSRNDPFEVQIWQDLGSLAKSCLKCKDLPQSLRAMSEARIVHSSLGRSNDCSPPLPCPPPDTDLLGLGDFSRSARRVCVAQSQSADRLSSRASSARRYQRLTCYIHFSSAGIQECIEGTMVSVFYHNSWYCATRKCLVFE